MVIHDWTDELEDFADTAALIAALVGGSFCEIDGADRNQPDALKVDFPIFADQGVLITRLAQISKNLGIGLFADSHQRPPVRVVDDCGCAGFDTGLNAGEKGDIVASHGAIEPVYKLAAHIVELRSRPVARSHRPVAFDAGFDSNRPCCT